jgi:ArsR family transcriptional regulator, arsenate/arsenite/antimonite-responsive transcriptional repressor
VASTKVSKIIAEQPIAADACCGGIEAFLEPKLFKALCDPTRVAVLSRLTELAEESTVSQVAACCTVDLSVVSRHLSVLRDAGIVESEKRGKEVYYRVRYQDLSASLRKLADAIDACCPSGTCE